MEYLKEPSGSGTLRLEGELNIQAASRLKETLVKAFAETDTLVLDLEGVTGIDISCMQLLCSAHKTFVTARKSLTVRGQSAQAFEQSVREGGFPRSAGCHTDRHDTCLWIIGGSNG